VLRNNGFKRHTDDERSECTALVSANIDTYAAELDLTGDRLTKARGLGAAWLNLLTLARVEEGIKNEAFQEFHLGLNNEIAHYVRLKRHLMSIINEYQRSDTIVNSYGFNDPAPNTYGRYIAAVEQLSVTNDRLVDEGDPRVLPAALVADLLTRRDSLLLLWDSAMKKNESSLQAFSKKRALYGEDSVFLSWLFSLARLYWGDDDPRLRLLGFVPASEVWTSGAPFPAPEHLAHDPATDRFTWDEVEGVEGYELQYAVDKSSPEWLECYRGEENSVIFRPEGSGDYLFRVRAYEKKVGKWSEILSVSYVG